MTDTRMKKETNGVVEVESDEKEVFHVLVIHVLERRQMEFAALR